VCEWVFVVERTEFRTLADSDWIFVARSIGIGHEPDRGSSRVLPAPTRNATEYPEFECTPLRPVPVPLVVPDAWGWVADPSWILSGQVLRAAPIGACA
jgi:hypothetical protein